MLDVEDNYRDYDRLTKLGKIVTCDDYEYVRAGTNALYRAEISYPYPVVMLQIALVNFLQALFEILLQPLGHQTFLAQMLAGLCIGPSMLGHSQTFIEKFFTGPATYIVYLLHDVGVILTSFLLSAQIDMNVVKKSGRLEIMVGIGSYILPMVTFMSLAFLFRDMIGLDASDKNFYKSIVTIGALQSGTSFHVVITILTHLKLLNSELGRLALTSSMISNLISWITLSFTLYFKGDEGKHVSDAIMLGKLGVVFIILLVVFIVRPVFVWMMRRTPQGKFLKEHYLVALILMVLWVNEITEFTGFHYFMGSIIVGIATPVSPPMGSCLMEKLGSVVWTVFLPCYIIDVGRNMNLYEINYEHFFVLEALLLVATAVKLLVTTSLSLYFKVPFMDALSLGLIMNIQGIFDVQIIGVTRNHNLLSNNSFRIMVISAMMKSTIFIMLLKFFYDTSRRYISYKTHTIQHIGRHAEIRILACIHDQNNASGVINILEASNCSASPIGVNVLDLQTLVGHTMPQVLAIPLDQTLISSVPSKFDRMINALNQFEERNAAGLNWLQCFTAIAPLDSMHEDICAMAFQKSTSLVIFPFQKTDHAAIRTIANNLIKMCPCSVGFLTIRGIFIGSKPIFSRRMTINVCVIFVGGGDDREALAYGARMTEHPNVMLTVVRFIALNDTGERNIIEDNHDLHMLKDFMVCTEDNKNVDYIERHVSEGSETAHELNAISNDFDFILVGRRHDTSSPVFTGLAEWNEFDEFGVIGDLLACSELLKHPSVLVIQQQASVIEKKMVGSPRHVSMRIQ